jgi:DNA-directed RNA polymerase specialized sigma24 family protein
VEAANHKTVFNQGFNNSFPIIPPSALLHAGRKEVDKSIVVLSDLEGLSDKEIAAAVGLTVSAVKTRLHRARLFLRGNLAVQLGYSAA